VKAWTVVLVAGAVTYGLKLSALLVLSRRSIPDVVRRAGAYVAPAMVAALAASALAPSHLVPDGAEAGRLLGAAVVVGVALRARSVILPLGAGVIACLLGGVLTP
jgi:branched-subunit amino acid transport protein